MLRRENVEGRHVLGVQRGLLRSELLPVDAGLGGSLEQRVVHVGDVLDVLHRQAGVPPDPVEQVERDVGVRVPEVGCVVRGDAADVHPSRTSSGPDADDESRSGVEGLGLGRQRGDRKSRHLGRRPGLHPATIEEWVPESRECRVSQMRLWTDDEASTP